MKLLLAGVAAISIFALEPTFALAGSHDSNHSPWVREAAACIRCTTRCGQCSNSQYCNAECKINGNPMVRPDSPCGQRYQTCGK
jgi:hypothetical protein